VSDDSVREIGMRPNSGIGRLHEPAKLGPTQASIEAVTDEMLSVRQIQSHDKSILFSTKNFEHGHLYLRVAMGDAAKREVSVNGVTYFEVKPPFHIVEIVIPKATLRDFPSVLQAVLKRVAEEQVVVTSDGVILGLIRCFLPAIDQAGRHNQTFFFHVVSALLLHLGAQYQGCSEKKPATRIGLRPWQESRAKELLLASPQDDMPISRLSAACGLSESHFARAFKVSTGLSTRQWLQEQRVAAAKNLLAGPGQEIAQIALDLGFSDQSHFTRVFSKIVGVSPGAWRRNERAH